MRLLWRFCPAAIVLASVLPAPAVAEEGGFYVGLRATGTYSRMYDISDSGFSVFEILDPEDLAARSGVVAGYRFGGLPLRLELDAGYRHRFDFNAQDVTGPVSFKSEVSTVEALFGLGYEFRSDSRFTPFVGYTLGWAQNIAETKRNLRDSGIHEFRTERTNNLAYGVFAGVNFAVTDSWSTELAYRFVDLGEVDTGRFAQGEAIEAGHYLTHDFMLTVRYDF